ncbi:UbiA prenyltransferase domain-containing protein 1 [Perkinsus olseni]|uniref:UbiA prenyltransferase domain-containing protein 1 n=1 Tax=Perkinsus olseni TaxID=32597 RepID=A0A7J6NKB3_PEROL|nr:UbiA prenyltransferase domain-containing protein 1 [Perkinsus olseni]
MTDDIKTTPADVPNASTGLGWMRAACTIVMGCVGVGILALPAVTFYNNILLWKTLHLAADGENQVVRCYEEAVRATYGTAVSIYFGVIIHAFLVSVCSAMLVLLGSTCYAMTHILQKRIWALIWTAIGIPFSWIKEVKDVGLVAAVGVTSASAMVIVILVASANRLISGSARDSLVTAPRGAIDFLSNLASYFFVFAFTATSPTVCYHMNRPMDFPENVDCRGIVDNFVVHVRYGARLRGVCLSTSSVGSSNIVILVVMLPHFLVLFTPTAKQIDVLCSNVGERRRWSASHTKIACLVGRTCLVILDGCIAIVVPKVSSLKLHRMVAKSKSSAAAAAGNSKSKKVEEKPHVAKESKMLPVVEMVVSGPWPPGSLGPADGPRERSFAGTVDELVHPAFPALPRQFCIVIHWVFTLISGCACIATLIGPVPVLGNRTVFMVGTKLMTVATACQCLVRVLAMGFNTTQLAPRVALIVALKGAARLSKISQGPSLFLTWFVSVRPLTFPAALAPLLVTAAVVNWLGLELSGVPHVTELIFSLVAVQASANQINSIADLWNGVDNVQTAADRSIVDGHMSMRTMIASAASLFGLFVALLVRCGMMVPPEYKLSLTVLATVGGLAAFIYTAGPLPFKYIGLGDLLIFITFGPMTTYYFLLCLTNPDQSTPIFGEIFLFTLPILLLVVAILNSNNIRDMEEDKALGSEHPRIDVGP